VLSERLLQELARATVMADWLALQTIIPLTKPNAAAPMATR
jgi:hypothetical protein